MRLWTWKYMGGMEKDVWDQGVKTVRRWELVLV